MTPNPLQIRAKSAQIERHGKGFPPSTVPNRKPLPVRRCDHGC